MPVTSLEDVRGDRLTWPESKPRRAGRTRGTFKSEISRATREIEQEMERWEIRHFVVSRTTSRAFAGDPGAALWWTEKGELRVLASDQYDTQAANLHAIALTLEAMRALDRWGVYTREQASEGAKLKALPPPEGHDWKKILGHIEAPGFPKDKLLLLAEHAYRSLAKEHAGNPVKLQQLNLAIEAARRELK